MTSDVAAMQAPEQEISKGASFLLLLAAVTAVESLAVDMVIPALPEMAHAFGRSPEAVQAVMWSFLVGLGVGQAVWGPVGDKIGRRLPILVGLVLFVAGALISWLAPNLTVAVAGRGLQAFGAGAGIALSRAMITDIWDEREAARKLSLLMTILGCAALVGPVIGAGIAHYLGFATIYALLAFAGLLILVWAMLALPETLPIEARHDKGIGEYLRETFVGVSQAAFVGPLITVCMSYALLIAMLSSGAFAFINELGWTVAEYTALYVTAAGTFVVASGANAILLKSWPPRTILVATSLHSAVISIGTLLITLAWGSQSLVIAIGFVLLLGAAGFVFSNATSIALGTVPSSQTGAASAAMGIVQAICGAVATPLAVLGKSPLHSMLGTASIMTAIAVVSVLFVNRRDHS